MTQSNRILLGVNIDHVATLRQARGTRYPDPVKAALDAEEAGADGITVHLREDRRHIQERDVLLLKDVLQTRMNFEMGVTEEMMVFAERIRPAHICLVPETRQELTTEGGLDVAGQEARIKAAVERLSRIGCEVSLFIDADERQIEASKRVGAPAIELHTGRYADAQTPTEVAEELQRVADGITVHLREDRRHIQERDVLLLKDVLQTRMNFEMGVTEEMMVFAERIRPAHICLVPETRQELTTEGGLDVAGQEARIKAAVERLSRIGCEVSLFIDADERQIEASKRVGAPAIELHTGRYADAQTPTEVAEELQRVADGVAFGLAQGLIVNAGHGLHYHNVEAVAAIKGINELNIGHALVAHALFVGFKSAVAEMKALIVAAAKG